MDFIAVVNYEHLDNSLFLTSLARAVSRKNGRGILLHADSEYTERIIQTGVMREEAQIRAMKDLNHRFIALMADEGVPAVGLHGFQKSLVKKHGERVEVDRDQLFQLPAVPLLIISSLCEMVDKSSTGAIPLDELAEAFLQIAGPEYLTLFSIDDHASMIVPTFPEIAIPEKLPEEIRKKHLSPSFHRLRVPVRLTTPDHF